MSLREEIENLALMMSLADTKFNTSIFQKPIRQAQMLWYNFPYIKKRTKKPHASNLILNGKFQTPLNIKSLHKRGIDLSLLNPPNSAFWTNNKVEQTL